MGRRLGNIGRKYTFSGKKAENMIRFICKFNFNETNRNKLSSDIIISNNSLLNDKGAFENVLDFSSNQEYYLFYKDENGKIHKKIKNQIKVRGEVEKYV